MVPEIQKKPADRIYTAKEEYMPADPWEIKSHPKPTDIPFITLDNITIRVRDKHILPETCWQIRTQQNWAILGPNGSGKSSLVSVLTGEVPYVRGKIIRHYSKRMQAPIGYVSFELHERLIARDVNRDEARFFCGQLDTFTKAGQTILSGRSAQDIVKADFESIVERLEIRYLLERGIRFLSTGEMRKVLIASALMKSPRLLILDEPFDGLDSNARASLTESIAALIDKGTQIILVTHRFEEIPNNISHVLCLKNCKVFCLGKREEILTAATINRLYDRKNPVPNSRAGNNVPTAAPQKPNLRVRIEMKNTTVKYGDQHVLKNLNWTVKQGQNWAVMGPNGSGKSTLLSLISGDNLQAYANEIYLFGKRRGTGESIWQIKKQIGMVSSELQVHYRKPVKVHDVVLSGFFDSTGLYRHCSSEQHEVAQYWLERFGLANKKTRRFDHLSFGEKRMVLLARSMVKSPTLLILDEPCQGLDLANRRMILDLVDYIGCQTPTQLIYVTHHPDEMPDCITHVLQLGCPGSGHFFNVLKDRHQFNMTPGSSPSIPHQSNHKGEQHDESHSSL
jgi:molybdate transport system ATP-binding protein